MTRAGALGGLAALAQIPLVLAPKGLVAKAQAIELDVVRDTLNAVLAFLLPGDDPYSVAQGETAPGPGGVASGTLDPLLRALDTFVPATIPGVIETTIPASGGVATLLNDFALQVNAAGSHGSFLSPFARLSYQEKAEVFRRFETDETISNLVPELKFVGGIMHGYVAFLLFSEAGVLDDKTKQLRRRPVGWEISGFRGPWDGYDEFKGYFQGRKSLAKRPRRRRRQRRHARRKR